MSSTQIILMKDRRREMIPIDRIKVINSRSRDETQFAMNVQSIDAIGQIKDIRVNDKFLGKDGQGHYELICGEGRLTAQKRLGKSHIRAARELKNLRDEGWTYEEIGKIACRTTEYVRQYIRLVENGEDRLIQGVEQDVFPISFAVLVATTEGAAIQNVLMDAFDQGIVNSQNFARARSIIAARSDRPQRKGVAGSAEAYTVATLTSEIASATQAKDSYVREAQGKEGRLFMLLDGIEVIWKDTALQEILQAEGLAHRPELAGTYSVAQKP
jgi:ParB family chromosome partitioning protein